MLLYPILLRAGRFLGAFLLALLLYCLAAWLLKAVSGNAFLYKDTPAILSVVILSLAIKDVWNKRYPVD